VHVAAQQANDCSAPQLVLLVDRTAHVKAGTLRAACCRC